MKLGSFFSAQFNKVVSQKPVGNSGEKIDLAINDNYGIEIKVLQNNSDMNEINRLVGQLTSYHHHFNHIFIILVNATPKSIDVLEEKLESLNISNFEIIKK